MLSFGQNWSQVRWVDHATPGIVLSERQTLEDAYLAMLSRKVDYAAVLNDQQKVSALAPFKNVAAVLGLKYGQALFAKKPLGEIRVSLRSMQSTDDAPRELAALTPRSKMVVFSPKDDFFRAQELFGRRPRENHFDDIVVTDENGCYAGMLPVVTFNRMQNEVLRWQESQLRERNEELQRTFERLTQTQGELVNAAKMASLGELSAGIAHELNTPLGILISSQDMIGKVFEQLSGDISPDRTCQLHNLVRANIELGREASLRVSHIVDSLRTFARKDSERWHEANLADLIDGALVLLANKLKGTIQVHCSYPASSAIVCYPSQLSQTFVNILSNAYQAMNGAGHIHITVARSNDRYVTTIRDTGPGIPEDIVDRIFDPGFTTKGVGVGTGLGLSISRKIIEGHHGGRLAADNSIDGGAIFLIELPVMPAVPVDQSNHVPLARPSETALP